MLGSTPLQAVLGSGIDNRDHDAVKAFIRQAADIGLSLLFIYPGSKVPADMRTQAQKTKDNKAAQAVAHDAGRRDWATVKSPAGLALATSEKTVLERYLKRYIEVFSEWREVLADGSQGDVVPYVKKAFDAGEIVMATPAAVNLAVEVGGSGVVVVDCDTAAQVDRFFEVAEIAPEDRPDPTVITPGQAGPGADPDDPSTWAHADGGHFWFTVPDELRPTLPRHIGAMTWGGDDGFAVLWDRRYVLIPPSTRPEGAYELVGRDYPLPGWLANAIIEAGSLRVARAERSAETANPELASAVDEWAAGVPWSAILEPLGWTPAPRADSCGCPVWTAPGVHSSPKSATAHDSGCTAGRYTEVNAPLHIWTDNPAEPFDEWVKTKGTATISKLQAVSLISYGGNVGKAMDELDLMPTGTEVDPDISPRERDPEHGMVGDGDFEMPTADSNHLSGSAMDVNSGVETHADGDCPVCGELGCVCIECACGEMIGPNDASEVNGVWFHNGHDIDPPPNPHAEWDAAVEQARQKADAAPPVDLSVDALPADFGKATKPEASASPFPDEVADADPDVFDSPHAGVPRIAPFGHWRDMPAPEYVIDGLIEHGGLSCIIGPPGMGKSSVVLDMACHIATGKRWQGRRTLKTKVLYLPGEGLAGAVQRLRAWEAAHGVEVGDNLLLGNGIILVQATNEAWGDIAAYIVRQGIELVIFDTFARMSSGLEENSATDVGKAIRRFDKLKDHTNAGVCVVHHTAKGAPETARGSSALNGALDSELLVREARWPFDQIADEDGRLPGKPIELWTTKQKNIEQLDEAIPLMMIDLSVLEPGTDIKAPVITGPNCAIDPMQGEVVLARPLPEPLIETAIKIREHVDRFPQQGVTRGDLVLALRPDPYAQSRNDTGPYWKQRIAEAVDRALRWQLIETLTGTPSGSRYIPSVNDAAQARLLAAAEINDAD
ncbi:DNA polymerase/primase [Mycobacterium phage LilMcDreamy]|uniref:DNA primase/polymerase n=1 Tax=Mycobacterium phage LilMcDreamy TaxID=2652422 RepID=A0A5P8D6K6_9CAUD|nr:DNA polymerase/primase [Mycobacterium phage LilMcDreamy]QFP94673.1 DNA primase/polymerase [Mycobacterium phage LilMcDreamy]